MPELPEVETVRNTLKHLVIGEEIQDVDIYYERIIQYPTVTLFKKQIKGEKIQDVLRYGKYLIFKLTKGFLISHLRMEGKYFLRENEEKEKHEHIIFYLKSGKTLRYHDVRKFGTMHLYLNLSYEELLKKEPLNKLGLEPFSNNLNAEYLKDKLKTKSQAIKQLLLDQSIITGIGNIYADEILFMARINPKKAGKLLNNDELEKIIKYTKVVLEKAIQLGGTTIRSYSSDGISGLFQNELLVHTKEKCPVCGKDITKIKIGGRSTYYCEYCQKE